MKRKKLPYLALFIDDWMASAKVRKCSETTRGVYIDILCVLHKEKRRGSYSLHNQELKPMNSRSKTQLALAKPAEIQRLPYFAEFLVKRTGSSKSVILKALQELYHREILVVEGDTLIQPRMYRDSGYHLLSDEENDNDFADTSVVTNEGTEDVYLNNEKDSTEKELKKSTKKVLKNPRARASRERAHTHNGSESENNKDNDSSIGGVGDIVKGEKSAAQKPARFTPPTQEEVTAYCQEKGYTFSPVTFFAHYEANGWVQGKGKPIKNWKACCVIWQQREQTGEFGDGRAQTQRRQTPPDTVQHPHDGGFDDMEGFG